MAVDSLGDLLREATDHADAAATAVDAGDPERARQSLRRLDRLLDRIEERTAAAEADLVDAAVDAWLAETGGIEDVESTSG
jgi:hypothetical protein